MTQADSPEEAIRHLAREVEKLNSHRFIVVQNSLVRLVLFQFLRGLAFGLGSVIGATLLVSVIGWWISQFEFLPLIGDWMVVLSEEFDRATGGAADVNQ
ncbi:MAG: hypothetical protein JXR13_00585 [Thalassovita sp.]